MDIIQNDLLLSLYPIMPSAKRSIFVMHKIIAQFQAWKPKWILDIDFVLVVGNQRGSMSEKYTAILNVLKTSWKHSLAVTW